MVGDVTVARMYMGRALSAEITISAVRHGSALLQKQSEHAVEQSHAFRS